MVTDLNKRIEDEFNSLPDAELEAEFDALPDAQIEAEFDNLPEAKPEQKPEDRGYVAPIANVLGGMAKSVASTVGEAITSPIETAKKAGTALGEAGEGFLQWAKDKEPPKPSSFVSPEIQKTEAAQQADKEFTKQTPQVSLGEKAEAVYTGALQGIPLTTLLPAYDRALQKAQALGKEGVTEEEILQAYQDINKERSEIIEKAPFLSGVAEVGSSFLPIPGAATVGKGITQVAKTTGSTLADTARAVTPIIPTQTTKLYQQAISKAVPTTREMAGQAGKSLRQDLGTMEVSPTLAIKDIQKLAKDSGTIQKEVNEALPEIRNRNINEATELVTNLKTDINTKINEVGDRFKASIESLNTEPTYEAFKIPAKKIKEKTSIKGPSGEELFTEKDVPVQKGIQEHFNEIIDGLEAREKSTKDGLKSIVKSTFEDLPENATTGQIAQKIYDLRGLVSEKKIFELTPGVRFLPERRTATQLTNKLTEFLDNVTPESRAINAEWRPLYKAKNALSKMADKRGITVEGEQGIITSPDKLKASAKAYGEDFEQTLKSGVGQVGDVTPITQKAQIAAADVKIPEQRQLIESQLPSEMKTKLDVVRNAEAKITPTMSDFEKSAIIVDDLSKAGIPLNVADKAAINNIIRNKTSISELLDKGEAYIASHPESTGLRHIFSRFSPTGIAAGIGTAIGGPALGTAFGATALGVQEALHTASKTPLIQIWKLARSETAAKTAMDNLKKLPADLQAKIMTTFSQPLSPKQNLLVQALTKGSTINVLSRLVEEPEQK